ncbi:thymidylate synthase [Natronogracilivirga saccharolytica]|uniref:Thymidylate synthase n=1 Tax=Natronogracilivirga saccharolytica TaxID=2812953 RepID=A0A8J7UWP9_9BACT|nr:thymidylate synthase [Natronogracilivirga saccharolytica]MBP3192474.1 thymidylate synthase [Natronogracilivirga saccharolytica]
MKVYQDLVERVLDNGVRKQNRTGTDTISSFSEFYKIDLNDGFPLLTTKKVPFRSVILELLWYLRGEDHIRWLRDEKDCHIWDAWADEDGHVGPIYPVMWRKFPYFEETEIDLEGNAGKVKKRVYEKKEFDQIRHAVDTIKNNPESRRIVINAWHPGLIDQMALPPCHVMFIFNVSNGRLNCHLTQRSGDIALGIPFNMACYAALTMTIAKLTGLEPGFFAHTIVDAHIYVNHIDGLKEQLKREPRAMPELQISGEDIDELDLEHFRLLNYDPHPRIPFEVAV